MEVREDPRTLQGQSSAGLGEKHTVINVIKCPRGFCDWLESKTLGNRTPSA